MLLDIGDILLAVGPYLKPGCREAVRKSLLDAERRRAKNKPLWEETDRGPGELRNQQSAERSER